MSTDISSVSTARIAEMVSELAATDLDAAVDAVEHARSTSGHDVDALALAARAISALGADGAGEIPPTGLRMAGYVRSGAVIDLRDDAPHAPPGELRIARYLRTPEPTRLVEHLSLRRWERTTVSTS